MKKVLSLFSVVAILAATVFIGCKKSSTEAISDTQRSKFYGKLNNSSKNLARGLNTESTFEDWTDLELLELAKEEGSEHNKSLLDIDKNLNFSTSSETEQRNFLNNHFNDFFGSGIESSDYMRTEVANKKYEENTLQELKTKIIADFAGTETSSSYCSSALQILFPENASAPSRESISEFEAQIVAENNLPKSKKLSLFMMLEIGYSSYNLWDGISHSSNTQYTTTARGGWHLTYAQAVDLGCWILTYYDLTENDHVKPSIAAQHANTDAAYASWLASSR